jgi:hypothetical protein
MRLSLDETVSVRAAVAVRSWGAGTLTMDVFRSIQRFKTIFIK